jgi:tartrate dehydrogenase/decarboxylase/D-malate dehydrogenase
VTAYRIALVPGDNIGTEVTAEARKVMAEAGTRCGLTLGFETFAWGAQHYLATGAVMPEDGPARLRQFDAVFLGAMGDPQRVPDRILSWGFTHKIRRAFRQYVNLRPVRLWPGVRSPLAEPGPIDLVVVRENGEGEYNNIGGPLYMEQPEELAIQTSVYTRRAITRLLRYAFELARTRRGHVTSVSKANALPFGMVLWDRVFDELRAEYPDVQTRRLNVDAAAMFLVQRPAEVDVLVASNMFGDILSDEAAAVAGGVGLAPSGNINPQREFPSMFEPVHGSAPDIAGTGTANPIAAILAGAMLLRHLGQPEAADLIEGAVAALLRRGEVRTPDLGGTARTSDVGEAVCALLAHDAAVEGSDAGPRPAPEIETVGGRP